MRKFRVQVNGNVYEVEVEELGSTAAPAAVKPVAASPAPSPATAPAAPAPAPAPSGAPAARPAGANGVSAPMPGTIIDIKVSVGQKVEPRTVVMLLEAMKMENEIFAGRAGVVKEIAVQKGSSVNTGDLLITIDPA